MSNRFKFPDGVKEKLRGARLNDYHKQHCRASGARQSTRSDRLYSLICNNASRKEINKVMNFKEHKQKFKRIKP
jgi:hypothetical protein